MRFLRTFLAFFSIFASSVGFATQQDYCDGFEAGYKMIKGEYAIVPICPIAPIAPIGSSDYREGFLDGMRKAQR